MSRGRDLGLIARGKDLLYIDRIEGITLIAELAGHAHLAFLVDNLLHLVIAQPAQHKFDAVTRTAATETDGPWLEHSDILLVKEAPQQFPLG